MPRWKAAAATYAGGIAFDRITTHVALKTPGAYEQNRHRQTMGGNLAADALVFAGAMGADWLLHRLVHPKAPRVLRGAAVGIYLTRGGLNLKVAWGER